MASFGGGGKAVRIPAWSVNPSLQGCGNSYDGHFMGVKRIIENTDDCLVIIWMHYLSQQVTEEDVFPDAEGWEMADPEEAAKWDMGSEFGAHAAAEMPTGT